MMPITFQPATVAQRVFLHGDPLQGNTCPANATNPSKGCPAGCAPAGCKSLRQHGAAAWRVHGRQACSGSKPAVPLQAACASVATRCALPCPRAHVSPCCSFYCPEPSAIRPCPPGYFCPLGSLKPQPCPFMTHCDEGRRRPPPRGCASVVVQVRSARPGRVHTLVGGLWAGRMLWVQGPATPGHLPLCRHATASALAGCCHSVQAQRPPTSPSPALSS